jgi:hypothetical protein
LVGKIDEGKIDQQLADAGWVTNGSRSEYLAIGESEDLYVLVHRSTWETEEPSYRGLSEWPFCQRRHVRACQVLHEDVLRHTVPQCKVRA